MLSACLQRWSYCSADAGARCPQVVTGANLSGELSVTFWPWLGSLPSRQLKQQEVLRDGHHSHTMVAMFSQVPHTLTDALVSESCFVHRYDGTRPAAGKSCYAKQVALIVFLAHIGCAARLPFWTVHLVAALKFRDGFWFTCGPEAPVTSPAHTGDSRSHPQHLHAGPSCRQRTRPWASPTASSRASRRRRLWPSRRAPSSWS